MLASTMLSTKIVGWDTFSLMHERQSHRWGGQCASSRVAAIDSDARSLPPQRSSTQKLAQQKQKSIRPSEEDLTRSLARGCKADIYTKVVRPWQRESLRGRC